MKKNVKHLIEALKSTGLEVIIGSSWWDDNYDVITVSNPNQDDDFYQLYFNKQTGRYASYVNDKYFVDA